MAAILTALEVGYRHIDTAQSYGSEAGVGEAVRRSGIPRSEVFITTKVADTQLDRSRFMASVERSLETIGLGPVDLLLIHWPVKDDAVPLEELPAGPRRGAKPRAHAADRRLELPGRPARARPSALLGAERHRHQPGGDPSLHAGAEAVPPTRERRGLTLTAYRPLGRGRRGVGSGAAAHRREARRPRPPPSPSHSCWRRDMGSFRPRPARPTCAPTCARPR